MEVLYLDQLCAVNFLVDYCVVLASARMAGVVLRRWRYALAAGLGTVYAALSVLPGLGWLALAPVKGAAGLGMALVAFGGERRFWRCAAVFFGTAALFGGTAYALSMAAGGRAPGNALRYASLRVLVPSFAVCYALVATVFRRRLRNAERTILPVTLTLRGKRYPLRAMRDSGNALRDPASGMAAAVMDADTLARLLGLDAPLPSDPLAALEALSTVTEGARLLPYSAVGVPGGLLAAFRPDGLVVNGAPEPLLVALSPTPVSPEGEYDMLLPGS